MKIIGHRGACGLAPENTVASLKKALEHQVDMIEFDLRLTRDGMVILQHDAELHDPAGNRLPVAEHDYAELKTHKPDLATFEEALAAINKRVPVYVEVKPGEPTAPIIKLIKDHLKKGWRPEHFRLASFSQSILLELAAGLPDIQKTVLEKWSGVRATMRARELGTRHILMNQRWLWWGFIRHLARSGYKIGAYTVNNPGQAKRWERHGLRAIVTNYPDRFEKRRT